MKKLILTLIIAITAIATNAREPYGDYIVRYIVDVQNQQYIPTYNPLKITHQGLQVKNTNAGTKTWAAHYQGRIRNAYASGAQRVVHNFYLTNQHVEFEISDQPLVKKDGKSYYIINFDGQYQLAEARF